MMRSNVKKYLLLSVHWHVSIICSLTLRGLEIRGCISYFNFYFCGHVNNNLRQHCIAEKSPGRAEEVSLTRMN